MNFKKIKEIIEKAKEAAPNPEMVRLAESFEELVLLHEASGELKGVDDWVAYSKRFKDSRQRMAEQLEKTAFSLGLSPEQMKAYFENPKNFSSVEWNEMQNLRNEALENKKESTEIKPKKLKIKNKNIRI